MRPPAGAAFCGDTEKWVADNCDWIPADPPATNPGYGLQTSASFKHGTSCTIYIEECLFVQSWWSYR